MNSNNTFKLVSLRGDIEDVLREAQDVFYNVEGGLHCKFAEIRQDLSKFSNDRNNDDFYPLKIYAENGIEILVSEVRTGYHSRSSQVLIEILELAGFTVSQSQRDRIYNEPRLSMTIWNERIMQQY